MAESVSIPPAWLRAGRIPSLDGLRALAVCLVVVDHVIESRVSHAHPIARGVAKIAGEAGVDMFFVLSGFLITTMLGRERDRTQTVSLGAFYLRRVLRIVPAFAAYLSFVAILGRTARVEIPTGDWIAALTYTMNFRPAPAWEVGHLWSLSIEEHFYLLWPPVLAVLDRRWAMRLVVALLLFEPLARFSVLQLAPGRASIMELWTPLRTDGILVGCLLALGSRDPRVLGWLDRATERWPFAAIAAIGALALAFVSAKLEAGVTPTVVALSLALLLWTALRREPRWLTHPWIATIGIGSYGIYLWQQLFLNPRLSWWTSPLVALALTALAAFLSYRIVERPFIRLGIGRRREAHEAPSPAHSSSSADVR